MSNIWAKVDMYTEKIRTLPQEEFLLKQSSCGKRTFPLAASGTNLFTARGFFWKWNSRKASFFRQYRKVGFIWRKEGRVNCFLHGYVLLPAESENEGPFPKIIEKIENFKHFWKIWQPARPCTSWHDFIHVFWPSGSIDSLGFSTKPIMAEILPIFRKILTIFTGLSTTFKTFYFLKLLYLGFLTFWINDPNEKNQRVAESQ